MKKQGLLHGEILWTIANMGHTDTILIGDAGMPCPDGVPMIDLAVTEGVPGFLDVLKVVMDELKVEKSFIDIEAAEVSPEFNKNMRELIGNEFPISAVPHNELKEMSKKAKAMIRTGEFTPYANIILQAGVVF